MKEGINIPVKIIKKNLVDDQEKEKYSRPEKIGRACLFLIAFLTPFFFLPLTISPVFFDKHILIIVLSLLSFFAYLIKVFQTRKIIYPHSSFSFFLIILLTIVVLSFLFSPYKFNFYKQITYPDSFINFLVYGLIFFLSSVFLEKKDIKTLLKFSLAGVFIACFFGLLQIIGRFVIPFDFTKQRTFQPIGPLFAWGVFSALGLFLLPVIDFKNGKGWSQKFFQQAKRAIWLFLLIFFSLNVIIFNSLFLWLILAVSLIFIAAYHFVFFAQSKRTIYLLVCSAIALLFLLIGRYLFFLPPLPPELNLTFSSTASIVKSTLTNWRYLLLGSGPGTFEYNFLKFKPLGLNQTNFWSFRFSQGANSFLTFLADLGILGFLSLIILLILFFKSIFEEEDEKISLLISPSFFLVVCLFFFPFFFSQGIFLSLFLGILTSSNKRKEINLQFFSENLANLSRTSSKEKMKVFSLFLFFVLLTFLNLAAICFFLKGYLAALYYQKGLKKLRENDFAQANNFLSRAIVLDSSTDFYKRDLSQILLQDGLQDLTAKDSQKNKEKQNLGLRKVSLAISVAKNLADSHSFEPLNWENLGDIYQRIIPFSQGAENFARNSYQKAIEMDPKNPRLPLNIAVTLVNSADKDKALGIQENWREKLELAKKFVDKSLKLKSNYQDALFLSQQISLRLKEKSSIKKREEQKEEKEEEGGGGGGGKREEKKEEEKEKEESQDKNEGGEKNSSEKSLEEKSEKDLNKPKI